MTEPPAYFLLQVKTVAGVTVATITATELWTDKQVDPDAPAVGDRVPGDRRVLDHNSARGFGRKAATIAAGIVGADRAILQCHRRA